MICLQLQESSFYVYATLRSALILLEEKCQCLNRNEHKEHKPKKVSTKLLVLYGTGKITDNYNDYWHLPEVTGEFPVNYWQAIDYLYFTSE